jgi:hypothetical protein
MISIAAFLMNVSQILTLQRRTSMALMMGPVKLMMQGTPGRLL